MVASRNRDSQNSTSVVQRQWSWRIFEIGWWAGGSRSREVRPQFCRRSVSFVNNAKPQANFRFSGLKVRLCGSGRSHLQQSWRLDASRDNDTILLDDIPGLSASQRRGYSLVHSLVFAYKKQSGDRTRGPCLIVIEFISRCLGTRGSALVSDVDAMTLCAHQDSVPIAPNMQNYTLRLHVVAFVSISLQIAICIPELGQSLVPDLSSYLSPTASALHLHLLNYPSHATA